MNDMEIQSLNPANGDLVGTVRVTPVDEIAKMVAKARSAQPDWARLGTDGRRQALLGAGERMVEAAPDVGRLLTLEMGKPLGEGVGEVLASTYRLSTINYGLKLKLWASI